MHSTPKKICGAHGHLRIRPSTHKALENETIRQRKMLDRTLQPQSHTHKIGPQSIKCHCCSRVEKIAHSQIESQTYSPDPEVCDLIRA
ncbi:rCG43275 [Rattus norvegicus]|uniref:RCG43275 n=1 Tax=Rattus norvegicus TaxID=10116 RepID=A6IWT8_RAT|nr:rCG43275 [Rattus norvegicus]